MKGSIERILSFSKESEKAIPQLFREKISILEPKVVSPYTWLSFRFVTEDPEFIWTYSPAINNIRQMSAANRGDPILAALPEADDLFTWSGNPHTVKARVISLVRALVPFPTYTSGRLFNIENGCLGLEDVGMTAPDVSTWNFQAKRFPQAAAWVPSRAVFIPRDLIKIQLHSLDPYYKDSIQTLYIDRELMTPVYKITYNSLGRRRKIVMGGFGLAQSADRSREMLYPSFTISINYETREAQVLGYEQISICSEQNLKNKLKEFEPRKLILVKKEENKL